MKQSQILLSLALLSILFYINIPPSPEDLSTLLGEQQLSSSSNISPPQNLSPYNISVIEETNITDASGKVIGSVTKEFNKTIIPELPQEEKTTTSSIIGIGKNIWPSNPMGGLIFLAVIGYLVVWPILKWLKSFIFT